MSPSGAIPDGPSYSGCAGGASSLSRVNGPSSLDLQEKQHQIDKRMNNWFIILPRKVPGDNKGCLPVMFHGDISTCYAGWTICQGFHECKPLPPPKNIIKENAIFFVEQCEKVIISVIISWFKGHYQSLYNHDQRLCKKL